jgi:hypothetical protein
MLSMAFATPLIIGGLLAFRPRHLLSVLEPLGFTDLDMNINFKPPRPTVRALWFISSVAVLTIQFVIAGVISPVVLFWRVLAAMLQGGAGQAAEVPRGARLLLLLSPKRFRESLVGDLEEEFYTIVLPRYGSRLARLWYWEQVACSLWPILWNLLKRAAGLDLLLRITK